MCKQSTGQQGLHPHQQQLQNWIVQQQSSRLGRQHHLKPEEYVSLSPVSSNEMKLVLLVGLDKKSSCLILVCPMLFLRIRKPNSASDNVPN